MEMSKLFYNIQKDIPADAEIPSHILMLRGCFIRKVSAGIYTFLPLGLRVLNHIENIIRDEMNQYAQELIMPALLPADLYKQTGRWDKYGSELFRLKDRTDRDFCLGPTHEEFFTDIVKNDFKTYKKLPIILYQIQNKFRDEKRPRYGVIRCKDFMMKDAYSFDLDYDGLDVSYQNMKKAYESIFAKCGLDYLIVDADSGAIGGSGSQEFMVKSQYGEDDVVHCDCCGFSSNIEKAPCHVKDSRSPEEALPIEEISTPNIKTIDELYERFPQFKDKFVKTLIYKADEKFVAVMIKANRMVNETKLTNFLDCMSLELADASSVMKVTNASVGFAGPVSLSIPILVDEEVAQMKNLFVGANKSDFHLMNVNLDRDVLDYTVVDLRNIEASDPCPNCGHSISISQGIEVGHIFKLGTTYSQKLDCTYIDKEGNSQFIVMGCYGIGVSRLLAAIVEQHHDDNGIIWPTHIAPYQVSIIPISIDDSVQMSKAYELYHSLEKLGISCLIDDRAERAGVKFKDSDLIGIPLSVVVGKGISNNMVEFKRRDSSNTQEVCFDNIISILRENLEF